MAYDPIKSQQVFMRRLELIRKKQKISYARLAVRSGVNVATVFETLRGKPIGRPTAAAFTNFLAIADALGAQFLLAAEPG